MGASLQGLDKFKLDSIDNTPFMKPVLNVQDYLATQTLGGAYKISCFASGGILYVDEVNKYIYAILQTNNSGTYTPYLCKIDMVTNAIIWNLSFYQILLLDRYVIGDYLYACVKNAASGQGYIYKIGLSDGTKTSVTLSGVSMSSYSLSMCTDGTYLYVINGVSKYIYKYDLNLSLILSVAINVTPQDGLSNIVYSNSDSKLYFSGNMNNNQMLQVNPIDLSITILKSSLSNHYSTVAMTDNYYYVCDSSTNIWYKIAKPYTLIETITPALFGLNTRYAVETIKVNSLGKGCINMSNSGYVYKADFENNVVLSDPQMTAIAIGRVTDNKAYGTVNTSNNTLVPPNFIAEIDL